MSIDRKTANKRVKSLLQMVEEIRPPLLEPEAELMISKWPDYRFLSPMEATVKFGELYQEQFRRSMASHIDRDRARNARGIDLAKLKSSPKELSSLWTARQHADRRGIRYQEYLSFCFDFAMNRRRKMLPRPNQLYFTKASREAWLDLLMKFWLERFYPGIAKVDDLPQYQFENYRGLPAQDGYRQFVLKRAKEGKKRWRDAMRAHSVEKRQVPIRNFLLVMDRGLFRRELQSLKDDGRVFPFKVAPENPITGERLWQSCFGVPHARAPQKEPCAACPQSQGCQKVAEQILAKVEERHGTRDPVRQRERDNCRERVRRHRLKKKLALTAAVS